MVHRNVFAFALVSASIAVSPLVASAETVLLQFTASWCGPCRQVAPTVAQLAAAGHPIRKIDIDQHPNVASRYRVTQIPCFVMLARGQEVDRVVGVADRSRLERMLARARTKAAPPMAEPKIATSPGPSDDNLVRSSVRIVVDDSQGHSYGTGTVIHAQEGQLLVVTCGHLFRDSKGQGLIHADLYGPGMPKGRSSRLLHYDLEADLGFLVVPIDGPVRIAPVAPAGRTTEVGDPVRSVGCDMGKTPTIRPTRVTAINRYQGPPNIEAEGAPVEGRSGGGLFNEQGELVGVCFAADTQDNEGLYVGLAAIHAQLDSLGLSHIYRPTPNVGQPALAGRPEPSTPGMPPDNHWPVPPQHQAAPTLRAQTDPPPDTPLRPSELAALNEIKVRAQGAEVICVIRPSDPSAKSEIIVVQDASPQFIRQLSSLGSGGSGPRLTSHAVPSPAPGSSTEELDALGWRSLRDRTSTKASGQQK